MNIPFFIRLIISFLISLVITSCDDDVSDIGSNVLTGTNIDVKTDELSPLTESISLKSVRTNNLISQYLGSYTDSILNNKSTYGILAQLSSSNLNNFNIQGTITKIEVKDKKLIIPLQYNLKLGNADGTVTYELDPNFKNSSNLLLEVRNSNFRLRPQNPNTNETQAYFADATDGLDNTTGGFGDIINSGTILTDNDMFEAVIPATEIKIEPVEGQAPNFPNIEIPLNKLDLSEFDGQTNFDFFGGSNFADVIKSIYIKPTEANQGLIRTSVTGFDNSARVPRIQIDFDVTTIEDEDTSTEKTATISGNFNLTSQFFNIINTPDPKPDAELVFLSPGAGSIAEVTLFNEDELNKFVLDNNVLINDARLVFTANSSLKESELPSLTLYRIGSGRSISNAIIAGNSALLATPATRNSANEIQYNFNVTNLAQLILDQSNIENAAATNIKLGLGLASPIDNVRFSRIFNTEEQRFANEGSIFSLKGISLFGTNSSKKPKLILKYTATNK